MASVVISHPEKVLFPDDGITKGELASYYEAIAPLMLPHLRKRPVTMERFHKGIGQAGFIQKSIGKGTPDWIERVEVPKKDGTVIHPLINDEQSLLWLANQNCITPHVWASRVPRLLYPDVCIFDLDPLQEDAAALRTAALAVRDLLDELGLTTFVKTSGSKGFHIAVPMNGKSDAGEVSTFAHAVGRIVVSRHPDLLTLEFSKADRAGRIYVDTGRNHPPATFACAYAVRPKATAPVSAPCTWDEVEKGSVHPQTFNVRNMAKRVAKVGDIWSGLHAKPHTLGNALKKVRAML
ncbi:MAG TPA: non-homologous end-joining DNA ligase [Gemmatimonadaceae bacterium]|nr:non-homologous end-joining DNA ligase [Gemmatimonadaceae bacterium]